MKNNFCRDLFSLVFTIVATTAFSQNKALKVGDAIPDVVWASTLQLVNSPEQTTTLQQDRDKLIILDFWDTWCQACLVNFPKMEKLQQDFGDKIKIIAVTAQDRGLIEKFFKTKNGQRYNYQSSIVDDKMFHTMFPHIGVPFIAWIKDGKVLSTTNAEQVTAENITKILDEKSSGLQSIVQMTRERPLFLSKDFDRQKQTNMRHYSILTKGIVPDIGGGSTIRKTEKDVVYGRQFTNLPLQDIYFSIAYELFKKAGVKEGFTEKRIIYDVKDRDQITGTFNPDGTFKNLDVLYNYECLVPESQSEHLYQYMLDDLNRFSEYKTVLEEVNTPCLVLSRTSNLDKLKTKGGDYQSTILRTPSILQNAPLQDLVNMLNGKSPLQKVLVDETRYNGKVDLKLSGIKNLEQLNQELKQYDLTITETERPILMLHITERQ